MKKERKESIIRDLDITGSLNPCHEHQPFGFNSSNTEISSPVRD